MQHYDLLDVAALRPLAPPGLSPDLLSHKLSNPSQCPIEMGHHRPPDRTCHPTHSSSSFCQALATGTC